MIIPSVILAIKNKNSNDKLLILDNLRKRQLKGLEWAILKRAGVVSGIVAVIIFTHFNRDRRLLRLKVVISCARETFKAVCVCVCVCVEVFNLYDLICRSHENLSYESVMESRAAIRSGPILAFCLP